MFELKKKFTNLQRIFFFNNSCFVFAKKKENKFFSVWNWRWAKKKSLKLDSFFVIVATSNLMLEGYTICSNLWHVFFLFVWKKKKEKTTTNIISLPIIRMREFISPTNRFYFFFVEIENEKWFTYVVSMRINILSFTFTRSLASIIIMMMIIICEQINVWWFKFYL